MTYNWFYALNRRKGKDFVLATQMHIQVPSTRKPTEGEENNVREACNLDLVGTHVTSVSK